MDNTDLKTVVESLIRRIDSALENLAEKIYTTESLCEYLHIAPKTLFKMRAYGEINYLKIGKKYLYTQSDVDNFINKNKYVFD